MPRMNGCRDIIRVSRRDRQGFVAFAGRGLQAVEPPPRRHAGLRTSPARADAGRPGAVDVRSRSHSPAAGPMGLHERRNADRRRTCAACSPTRPSCRSTCCRAGSGCLPSASSSSMRTRTRTARRRGPSKRWRARATSTSIPTPIRRRCARRSRAFIGVPMEHILCGAGGDEVIDLLARAFVEPGQMVDRPAAHLRHVQVGGRRARRRLHRRCRAVTTSPWTSTPWRAPCARFEASGAPPKLLFVTNPNNPDGSVTRAPGSAAAARSAGRGRGGRGLHRLQRRSRAWRRWCPSATT